tara:strand:+ start:53 stop:316 length:264 start_codon:yes stop_codon:yes gene_type:complete
MQYIVEILTFSQHLFLKNAATLVKSNLRIMSNYKYYITVLSKVSFDNELFSKEYKKACRDLNEGDLVCLKRWHRVFLIQNPHLELIQ